jgi:phosphatidylinositol kinase/protein kinase (PI-3  family)
MLIDNQGHLIHIDFSFSLELTPFVDTFAKPPFRLTGEFIELLGGFESEEY